MPSQPKDPPRLLITRPARQAAAFAAALDGAAPGRWTPVIAPLTQIRQTGAIPPLAGVAALVFTSVNGVEAFMAACPSLPDLPTFCVGPQTAAAARDAGLTVDVLGPDAAAMAHALAARPGPGGSYLHIRGAESTGDIVETLRAAGHRAEAATLYEQHALPLEPSLRDALRAGRIAAVALFSPRSVARYLDAVQDPPPGVVYYCLSDAVADALPPMMRRAQIRVAKAPTRAAMIAILSNPEGG